MLSQRRCIGLVYSRCPSGPVSSGVHPDSLLTKKGHTVRQERTAAFFKVAAEMQAARKCFTKENMAKGARNANLKRSFKVKGKDRADTGLKKFSWDE